MMIDIPKKTKWRYKRFCRCCGEAKYVNGKFALFCDECKKKRYEKRKAYRLKKKLLKQK